MPTSVPASAGDEAVGVALIEAHQRDGPGGGAVGRRGVAERRIETAQGGRQEERHLAARRDLDRIGRFGAGVVEVFAVPIAHQRIIAQKNIAILAVGRHVAMGEIDGRRFDAAKVGDVPYARHGCGIGGRLKLVLDIVDPAHFHQGQHAEHHRQQQGDDDRHRAFLPSGEAAQQASGACVDTHLTIPCTSLHWR
jgi:hypothetical protein